jgi:hypothetical protein
MMIQSSIIGAIQNQSQEFQLSMLCMRRLQSKLPRRSYERDARSASDFDHNQVGGSYGS